MNKKKIIFLITVCMFGISLPLTAIAQTTARRGNIRSVGNINFQNGEVYIHSADLTYLADEIDELEKTYKTTVVNSLNNIGTFFKNDGTNVRDRTKEEADTEEEITALSFGQILDGILKSQSVEELASTQARDELGNLLYYETEEASQNKDLNSLTTSDTGFPVYYQAVNAECLAAGTAAWVNGVLIKGNGSLQKASYTRGWLDGKQDTMENLDITYQYHVHQGESTVTANGCYTLPFFHSHDNGKCYNTCAGIMKATELGVAQPDGSWKATIKCVICNRTSYDIGSVQHAVGQEMGSCGKRTLKCGFTTDTILFYTLGCGKTEETIESATIIF